MKLHQTVSAFILAQNSHDSAAFVKCFSESAIVHDEGKTHIGRAAIRQWIEKSDQEYQSELRPLDYKQTGAEVLLTAEVSGTFPGSPAILEFHLILEDQLIRSLSISG